MKKTTKKTAEKLRKTRPENTLPPDRRRTVLNATKGVTITIKEEHIALAKPCNPGECVIGLALADLFGGLAEGFQVGSNITKIYMHDSVVRFSTPSKLRWALVRYDESAKAAKDGVGKWNLPAGQYTLLPLAKEYLRGGRWHKKRNSGKRKQDVFRGAMSIPTRRVMRITSLQGLLPSIH